MFDIGFQELILIFVLALLVFGPKNLPQLGRSLGRAMREFRRASDEFRSTIETNLQMNEPDPPPFRPAVEPTSAVPEPTTTAEATPEEGLSPVGTATAEQPGERGGDVPPGERFVAQRGARLFHSRGCGWAARVPEAERIYFKKVAEAKEAGHLVCPSCDPWEPA
jgi:TatA/E family protein of Tat protein translocase